MTSRQQLSKPINALLAIIILLNAYVYLPLVVDRFADGELQLFVLDVGQGDAILLRTPEGRYGLIDGGRGSAVLNELAEVMPVGTMELEFVLATHPDADHIEGLAEVLKRYKVHKVFWQKTNKESSIYDEMKQVIAEKNIEDYELRDDTDFRLGCCVVFDVLWPRGGDNIYNVSDVNDVSTAVVISYEGFSMWTGGDLGKDLEEEVAKASGIDVDILKVGHHGSATSTSLRFLRQVSPEVALLSFGANNRYGHPHADVLSNLDAAKVATLRTDLHGRIELRTDGKQLVLFTQKGVENLWVKI